MNTHYTGASDVVEPGFSDGRPLRGFRKRWSENASGPSGSQCSSPQSGPSLDPCRLGDSGPDEGFDLFGGPSDLDGWLHISSTCLAGADEQYEPSSPAEEEPGPAGVVSLADWHGTEPAWQHSAINTGVKRQKRELPKLPWEQGAMSQIFRTGDKWHGTVLAGFSDMFLPTAVGREDVLQTQLVEEHDRVQSLDAVEPPVVRLNVKRVRRELPDEDIRRVAILKIRDIILQDPLATQLGTAINNVLSAGGGSHLVDQSICDCFRAKASSTLQKRAGSLWKLTRLLRQTGVLNPLRLKEEQLYMVLCLMREQGAGATAAQHMLEALHFLEATAKLVLIDLRSVISGRCRGVARDMFLTKNPLEQKHPLKLEHVRFLESLFNTLPSTMQCILGQLLFCVHACCRWKDSQRIKALTVETGHGETLIHADAISSKTALSAEAKTRFLPYVAIGTGVTGEDWGSAWILARETDELGFNDFALPSFSERSQQWTAQPMSASEATYWLREYLGEALSPSLALKFGSHSCKSTLLTWAGRCTKIQFSPTERRLLGHHLEPNMRSILTYSREAFTSLYAKVLMMFRSMRDGSFDPDLPAIDRVVQHSECLHAEPSVEIQNDGFEMCHASDSESSVASECNAAEDETPRQSPREQSGVTSLFPCFPGVCESSLLVHRVSGLVHVMNEDGFLLCGRAPSVNFKLYSETIRNRSMYEGCSQCKRSFDSRDLL